MLTTVIEHLGINQGNAVTTKLYRPSNDIVERPGAASGDRSARTTGCAANGTNNERTDK